MNDAPKSTCQLDDGSVVEYDLVGSKGNNYGPDYRYLGQGIIKTVRGVEKTFPANYVRHFFVRATSTDND